MENYEKDLHKYLDRNQDFIFEELRDEDGDGVPSIEGITAALQGRVKQDYSREEFNYALWQCFSTEDVYDVKSLLRLSPDDREAILPYPDEDGFSSLINWVHVNMNCNRSQLANGLVEHRVNWLIAANQLIETFEMDCEKRDTPVSFQRIRCEDASYVADAHCDTNHVCFEIELDSSQRLDVVESWFDADDRDDEGNHPLLDPLIKMVAEVNCVETNVSNGGPWLKLVKTIYFRVETIHAAQSFLYHLKTMGVEFAVTAADKNFNLDMFDGSDDEDDRLCLDSDDPRDVVVEFNGSLTDQQEDSVKTLLVDHHKVRCFRRRLIGSCVENSTFHMVVDSRDQAYTVLNAITNLEREMELPKSSISFPA